LESHEVQRVGALKPRKVDIRVVAATNVDLEAAVKRGTFRLDLFHRLDGVSVALPPLRARKSEIPLLARLFLNRACEAEGPPLPRRVRRAAPAQMITAWREKRTRLRRIKEISRHDLSPGIQPFAC